MITLQSTALPEVGDVFPPELRKKPIAVSVSRNNSKLYVAKLNMKTGLANCMNPESHGVACFLDAKPQVGQAIEIIMVRSHSVHGKLVEDIRTEEDEFA